MLNIKEIAILIVASERPKILNVTSLQLMNRLDNCSKTASLVKLLMSELSSQTKDSSINPCSIPK